MNFGTSIHCMDGRIQLPLINYFKSNFDIINLDTITEPGPCKILAENKDKDKINSIFERIEISVNNHSSNLIAISGHFDCAGNPCAKDEQINQIYKSVNFLNSYYPKIDILGLWIDENWVVHNLFK